jgi:hypothetical protein
VCGWISGTGTHKRQYQLCNRNIFLAKISNYKK